MPGARVKTKTIDKNKRFKKIIKALDNLKHTKQPFVKNGILAGAGMHEPPAPPPDFVGPPSPPKNPLTVAMIAAIHEFGAPSRGIPQRSFLRAAIDANRRKLLKMNKQLLRKIEDGEMTMETALGLLGETIMQMQKEIIKKGIKPRLKDATLAKKGSGKSTPLIDSAQMINSLTYEVKLTDKERK